MATGHMIENALYSFISHLNISLAWKVREANRGKPQPHRPQYDIIVIGDAVFWIMTSLQRR